MADDTVSRMRFLAAATLNRTLDPYLSPQENLKLLQKTYQEVLPTLSEREQQYFAREMSNELVANRTMRLIDVANREEDVYRPDNNYFNMAKRNIFTLDNITKDSRSFPENRPEYTDDEKQVLGHLLEGRHLSEFCKDAHSLSDQILDRALALYPLDTVRYLKATRPEVLPDLAYRAGIHAVSDANPTDAEQFSPKLLSEEFARISQESAKQFADGFACGERSNHVNAGLRQHTYQYRPLASEELEERRRENTFLAANTTSASDYYTKLGKKETEKRQFVMANQTKTCDAVNMSQEKESPQMCHMQGSTMTCDAPIPQELANNRFLKGNISPFEAMMLRSRQQKVNAKHKSLHDQYVEEQVVAKIENFARERMATGIGYRLGGDDCSKNTWDTMKNMSDVFDGRVGQMLQGTKKNAETQVKTLSKLGGETFRGLTNCSPETLQQSGHRVFMVAIEKKEKYPHTDEYRKKGLAGENIHHTGILIVNPDGTPAQFYENTSQIKEDTGKNGLQKNTYADRFDDWKGNINWIQAVAVDGKLLDQQKEQKYIAEHEQKNDTIFANLDKEDRQFLFAQNQELTNTPFFQTADAGQAAGY